VPHATTKAPDPARDPRGATIRRATADDARAIAEVRVDAWRSTSAGIVPRALIGRRIVAAVGLGASGLLTWVIAANRGARAFYEHLGAGLVVEQPAQWDGLDPVESGYGWRGLDAPALACARLPHRQ
jgi:hypothetical protein